MGHHSTKWVFAHRATPYLFGYGSRGRRASPVSPMGERWLWGVLKLLKPLFQSVLCVFALSMPEPPWRSVPSVLRVLCDAIRPSTAMRALSASSAFRVCVVIGSDVVPRNKLCCPHLACVLCSVMFLGKGLAT